MNYFLLNFCRIVSQVCIILKVVQDLVYEDILLIIDDNLHILDVYEGHVTWTSRLDYFSFNRYHTVENGNALILCKFS